MPPMQKPPTHDVLDDLARAMRTEDDELGHSTWFDRIDHEVHVLTLDPEDGLEEPDPDAPPWIREQERLARRILDDPGRYRRVPFRGAHGQLQVFIESVPEALQEPLQEAAQGGRGAYRRVRAALRERGLEHLWHDFETQADRAMAIAWLRSDPG